MGGREALEQRQIGQPLARQSFLAAGALQKVLEGAKRSSRRLSNSELSISCFDDWWSTKYRVPSGKPTKILKIALEVVDLSIK